MSCGYCKDSIDLLEYEYQIFDGNEGYCMGSYVSVSILGCRLIMFENKDNNIDDSIKINYCPMCGEKLE